MKPTEVVDEYYYLRDFWGVVEGRPTWMRRQGAFKDLAKAQAEARRLAKGIGKGARVQIVHVRSSAISEVQS